MTYEYLVFEKYKTLEHWKKGSLFNNGAGTTGHSHIKKEGERESIHKPYNLHRN